MCAKSWHVAFVQHSRMVSRVLRPAFHSHPRISSSPKSCKTGISFHFTDPKTESPPSQPCPAPRSWCEAETRDSNTSQCSAQVRRAHAAPARPLARSHSRARTHTHFPHKVTHAPMTYVPVLLGGDAMPKWPGSRRLAVPRPWSGSTGQIRSEVTV